MFAGVKNIYSELSRSVHGVVSSFQTTPERFSPTYTVGKFKKWADSFKKIQIFANTILALGFAKEFKKSGANIQRKILRAIEDKAYKQALRRALGLRIRGRV